MSPVGRTVCGLYRGRAVEMPPGRPVLYGDCFYAIREYRFVDRRRDVAYGVEVAPVPGEEASGERT